MSDRTEGGKAANAELAAHLPLSASRPSPPQGGRFEQDHCPEIKYKHPTNPQSTRLADNKRLHLNHGPIDLIIEAFGSSADIATAYQQASKRFQTILAELAVELPLLRTAITPNTPIPERHIARAMRAAAKIHAPAFITPMAAVAGAVADEVLTTMCTDTNLDKAYVNNGGDIAIHLNPDNTFKIGVIADPRSGKLVTRAAIHGKSPIRGIATSGRHGRSHSLGIADGVTVFAGNSAIADAAATIIANAVDLPGNPAVTRQPANELSPDSDLGSQLVTISVGQLSKAEFTTALDAGVEIASRYCKNGTIRAAFLSLQGYERIVGWPIDQPTLHAPHSIDQTQLHRIANA
ncbi:MAG: UPF0280 family protein [Rhodobacteraceae bacterium]|nr:UPF0280 family protein [Paracoccaceae bacterium]